MMQVRLKFCFTGNSTETILAKKYAEAITVLTPLLVQETQKKFANTILEGKQPQNKYVRIIIWLLYYRHRVINSRHKCIIYKMKT